MAQRIRLILSRYAGLAGRLSGIARLRQAVLVLLGAVVLLQTARLAESAAATDESSAQRASPPATRPVISQAPSEHATVLAKEPLAVSAFRITALVRKQTDTLLILSTTGGVVETTEEHPFAKVGHGWTAARKLTVGDAIQTADDRPAHIQSIQRKKVRPRLVYNLTVEHAHSYFVGQDRLLVHNVCERDKREQAREGLARFRRSHSYHETGESPLSARKPPTSGVRIPVDAPHGSYIIGTFSADMERIVHWTGRYVRGPGQTVEWIPYPQADHVDYEFPVAPGHKYNLLNITMEEFNYWKKRPGGFFGNVNGPWIDSAVRRQSAIYVATDPSVPDNLYERGADGQITHKLRAFGKEVHRLEWKHNYHYDPVSHEMVPPGTPGWASLPTLTRRNDAPIHEPVPDDRPKR